MLSVATVRTDEGSIVAPLTGLRDSRVFLLQNGRRIAKDLSEIDDEVVRFKIIELQL